MELLDQFSSNIHYFVDPFDDRDDFPDNFGGKLMDAVSNQNQKAFNSLLTALKGRYQFEEGLEAENTYYIHLDHQGGGGETCLIRSVNSHQHIFVQKLVDAGADLNLQNDYGETALHVALREGDEVMVEMLLLASRYKEEELCDYLTITSSPSSSFSSNLTPYQLFKQLSSSSNKNNYKNDHLLLSNKKRRRIKRLFERRMKEDEERKHKRLLTLKHKFLLFSQKNIQFMIIPNIIKYYGRIFDSLATYQILNGSSLFSPHSARFLGTFLDNDDTNLEFVREVVCGGWARSIVPHFLNQGIKRGLLHHISNSNSIVESASSTIVFNSTTNHQTSSYPINSKDPTTILDSTNIDSINLPSDHFTK